jgi:hypothetical protein
MPLPSETPSPDESLPQPRNKGGRPKGSKTRPKWLRESLKRPRGRPKGSKNKPKTILGFLQEAVNLEKPKRLPKREKNPEMVRLGKLRQAKLTPEEKAEGIKRLRECKGGRKQGVPTAYDQWTYRAIRDDALKEIKRIVKIMDQEGSLPENPLARQAMMAALELLAEPGTKDMKLKVLRTILEYNLAKPVVKTDVTVRTAEDWLAELASKEDDASPND